LWLLGCHEPAFKRQINDLLYKKNMTACLDAGYVLCLFVQIYTKVKFQSKWARFYSVGIKYISECAELRADISQVYPISSAIIDQ
jgi:hypothetical protein